VAEGFADHVAGVAALAEPVRRDLYRYVVASPEPVSRDQAADGTGIARHTVKFHLDRLVEEGLLETESRRLSGRRGPGAGRPAKLYKRSDVELSVTLPERHYDLAARLMAQAIEESAQRSEPVVQALGSAAAEVGAALGDRVRAELGGRASKERVVGAACTALAGCGYEPRRDGTEVLLANCPFHRLAREHTELVCGMNLSLVSELVTRGSDGRLTARLDPAEGRCCVTIGIV
jgi:predicted ArsR family transcriptional regulator